MTKITQSMIFLFLAQVCVAINIVVYKGLIDHISPFLILAIRFTLSSLFILVLVFRLPVSKRLISTLSRRDWLILAAEGLGAGIMFNAIMLCGLHYTDANSAGLITSMLPAVVISLGCLLFKEQLTGRMLRSILIAVAGLILINLHNGGIHTKNVLLGNLLVFLALIPDALYYVLSKYHPVQIHTLFKTLLLNAINLPILYIIILFIPHSYWQAITLHDYPKLILIGINSGLFFVLWQKGITHIDAAYAAISTAFMPVATAILAWLILGESLNLFKLCGMLLVIMSIFSYARK